MRAPHRAGTATAPPARALLVLGGGGTLGAALLARALASGRFAHVQALVARPLASAMRAFEPLSASCLGGPVPADTAFIVFERARRNNGRDEAFVQPLPQQLLGLAAQLRRGGMRRLLVVVPHAPALLPQALNEGLASLDEGGVAALGFEQLVFVRAAQPLDAKPADDWARRIGAAWWSQLAWMVPPAQQSVRTPRLAELLIELAWRLPQAPSATRVLAPQVLWQAAHAGDAGLALSAWLSGAPMPLPDVRPRRW